MKSLPIALVERESGISKDALRIWERRYGFPAPRRDANGDRCYPADQVQKLRLIKQLMKRGNRPAKLVTLSKAELAAMLADSSNFAETLHDPFAATVLDLLEANGYGALIDTLTQRLAVDGLVDFVVDRLAPLNVAVGQAWALGRIGVAQEHLYTEIVQKILRAYLLGLRVGSEHQRVLLATLPGEQHGLGLLMVECVIAAKGVVPISLGTEVPIDEIAKAAVSQQCQAVAISFSRARTPAFVSQGVRALREKLEPSRQLWIGGAGGAWLRQPVMGALHIADLRMLQEHLLSWTPPAARPQAK